MITVFMKTLSVYKKKIRCSQSCLRIGLEKSIESLVLKKGRLHDCQQLSIENKRMF